MKRKAECMCCIHTIEFLAKNTIYMCELCGGLFNEPLMGGCNHNACLKERGMLLDDPEETK